MRTIIIYNDSISDLKYVILDGDYSRFNGVYISACAESDLEKECIDFLFDKDTAKFLIDLSENSSLIENKQWDKVAIITFLP